MTYTRDDIYYCPGCGQFFDEATDQRVEVPYSEMPAEFALQVMNARKKRPSKSCHTKRSVKKSPKPKNGFAN